MRTFVVSNLLEPDDAKVSRLVLRGEGVCKDPDLPDYLLEKFNRTCVYCGKKNVPFEIEHIIPKSRDGSSRVKSLAIACHECNLDKGDKTAEEYGHPEVQAKAAKPLKDAAAVNATRWKVFTDLQSTGLPISTGSGGRTKFNRITQGYPKTHWIDAACAGVSGEKVYIDVDKTQPLLIKAMGRQSRQMVKTDQYGFPKGSPKERSSVHGFKTGDRVRGDIPKGKYRGVHVGRIAVRKSGTFRLNSGFDVHWKYCSSLHCSDAYEYQKGIVAHSPTT